MIVFGYVFGYVVVLYDCVLEICGCKVIDVVGDGIINDGFGFFSVYKVFNFDNVMVNGLVIGGSGSEVVSYYCDVVFKGFGVFIEIVDIYVDYGEVMKCKLVCEIFGSGYVVLW